MGLYLRADKTTLRIGEESKINAKLLKSDGTPEKGVPTDFTIRDNKVLTFKGDSNPRTDEDGNATVEVQGKDKGQTIVTVKATLEGKLQHDEIIISVTE